MRLPSARKSFALSWTCSICVQGKVFMIVKTIKVGQRSQSAVENDDGATCTYQMF
jgi:hypothetical protein